MFRISWRFLLHTWVVAALSAVPFKAEALELSFPVACSLGRDCFIQNYPDVDPSSDAADFTCGESTYNGHSGTDIRLLSTTEVVRGVAVLASAAGKVHAVRDGMRDRIVTEGDRHTVSGRECGNGVLIDHEGGWQTQYCHLRAGSVLVESGSSVERGQPIGQIGYSGDAQFAHLHFTVRLDEEVMDPFTGAPLSGDCGQSTDKSLWRRDAESALAYRGGEIIELGFTNVPVNTAGLEAPQHDFALPSRDGPALIFFARSINLQMGDRQTLTLRGPSGLFAELEEKPLEHHKAVYVAYVGKRTPAGGWPAGTYVGEAKVVRGGRTVIRRSMKVTLD